MPRAACRRAAVRARRARGRRTAARRTQCYHPRVRTLFLCVAVFSFFGAACHPGGEYAGAGNSIVSGDVDKGETNGRMFDFVSDKPEGDDWQIRVRGTSIWVSYTDKNGKTDNRGTKALTQAESDKLWKLVDEVDIPSRKG